MGIKIKDEPDVYLTQSQWDKYRQQYEQFCRYHVSPCSFETFVRSHEAQKQAKAAQ